MEKAAKQEELEIRCMEQAAKIEQLNQLVTFFFLWVWNSVNYYVFSIISILHFWESDLLFQVEQYKSGKSDSSAENGKEMIPYDEFKDGNKVGRNGVCFFKLLEVLMVTS